MVGYIVRAGGLVTRASYCGGKVGLEEGDELGAEDIDGIPEGW